VEAAQAEGYTDFSAQDLCPRTGRLFRLAGFRLEARELARRVLGIGNALSEPRVRLCRLSEPKNDALYDANDEAKAWDALNEADLVIAALGYRPRALRLLDSNGQAITLAAHGARGAALVDQECRVLDGSGQPVDGVLALGLAAGFVPGGPMGGEPSFRGQTNGLWLWQNDIGAMVMQTSLPTRAAGARRRVGRLRVAVIVGTRPEAIKLAPVILAMRDTAGVTVSTWCTGQHSEWAPRTLGYFGLKPDRTIGMTDTGNGLARLGGTLLLGLQAAFQEERPDVVIVQGDTASAFMGTLAAGYARIPVVHVEAGLRSGDRGMPFPEEAHRRAIAQFAALHCAPTEAAADHLRREGIDERDILVCGNTVIDALNHTLKTLPARKSAAERSAELPRLLLTCHRRENWGAGFVGICVAMRRIAQRGDCQIVFVLHPNPALARVASRMLGSLPNIELIAPQGYPDFIRLMTEANVILTDSGGVQEEATALGTPLLVLRENTERPEALWTEHAKIVGTREADIVAAVAALLDDRARLFAPREPSTVYGDGHAARRIADAVARRWTGSDRRASAWVDAVGNPETLAANSDQGSGSISRIDKSVLGSRG
jgi:UDP-N-acetylglucosamine 2-epimerase (non-hydrolysing)